MVHDPYQIWLSLPTSSQSVVSFEMHQKSSLCNATNVVVGKIFMSNFALLHYRYRHRFTRGLRLCSRWANGSFGIEKMRVQLLLQPALVMCTCKMMKVSAVAAVHEIRTATSVSVLHLLSVEHAHPSGLLQPPKAFYIRPPQPDLAESAKCGD